MGVALTFGILKFLLDCRVAARSRSMDWAPRDKCRWD
jgi:hypothetical protein